MLEGTALGWVLAVPLTPSSLALHSLCLNRQICQQGKCLTGWGLQQQLIAVAQASSPGIKDAPSTNHHNHSLVRIQTVPAAAPHQGAQVKHRRKPVHHWGAATFLTGTHSHPTTCFSDLRSGLSGGWSVCFLQWYAWLGRKVTHPGYCGVLCLCHKRHHLWVLLRSISAGTYGRAHVCRATAAVMQLTRL